MDWTTGCPDWEARIVRRESLIVSPPLFLDQADEAWEIFGGLRLVDVAGQPTMKEACLPWVKDWVRTIFGAYDSVAGRRLINEFFFMVSKKNAKSTTAAGVMLTALIMNWRPSAELLILSPTKEIADNSYKPIRDMINADEALKEQLKVQDYFRTITHKDNLATLKVVAADSDAVSGKKASFVFVDELHEFGKQAKASNMLLEATGGLTSRADGFVIYATTQSAEPPAGVFKDKLMYARKVRDGEVVDRRFLPLIYEFPAAMLEAGAEKDLANAYVTNPNWGASVDVPRIEQLHSQALEGGEEKFKEFLSKHLNVEIGLALRSDRWAGADFWERQGDKSLTLESFLARSEVVDVGIDGGGLDDLLGMALVGRDAVTHDWLHWGKAWAHPSVLERRKSEAPRFKDFAAAGDLTLVETVGDDVDEVVGIVQQVLATGKLDKIGVDPVGIGAILDALEEAGVEKERVVGVSQGWRLGGAIKTTERCLAGGTLHHGGSPLMAWSVSNARVEPRANSILITKQASGTAKIDPLMALFNAVSLMSLNPASNVIGAEYELVSV